LPAGAGVGVYLGAVELLGAVRRTKSEAKVSPRTPVERVTFRGPSKEVSALRQVEADLRAAQNIAQLVLVSGDDGQPAEVEVQLASLGR
jgi:valyl-tRNA synthetase